jgi:fibronectin-binding autotransporter adhesin
MKATSRKTLFINPFAMVLMAGSLPLHADIRTWDGEAFLSNSWNSANNWSSNTVPASSGTAAFSTGNNGKTTVGFTSNTTISEILFRPDSPAYRFNVAVISLNLSGPGVVNSSTNTQTFTTSLGGRLVFNGTATAGTKVAIENALLGSTTFHGASSAGSAAISNTAGSLTFNDGSTAANAIISNTAGSTTFSGSSMAGHATIANTAGNTTFSEVSTAANATISNVALGNTIFTGSSTAGNANISNSLSGFTTFRDTANAGHATLFSGSLGFLNFEDSSSAANATILNELGGLTTFSGSSSGGNSTITNTLLGATVFTGASTAGAATISNAAGGATSFSGSANAGTALITSGSLGLTNFDSQSSAANATLTNTQGGLTSFSGAATGGNSSLANTLLGLTTFSGSSTAGNATISNSLLGVTTFSGVATAGNASITNQLLGSTTFNGSSTAGGATISNSLGGFTVFSEDANAGTAGITSGTLGAVAFGGRSSAANANLTNTLGGLAAFSEEATAGSANIVNELLGAATFGGFSTAGNATITNSLGGFTIFSEDANAGSAWITSGTLGAVTFSDRASASSAVLFNTLGGLAAFGDETTAAHATIVNDLLGVTTFGGFSTAGSAFITNTLGGFTVFSDDASAGSALIQSGTLGATMFLGRSTAAEAAIENSQGGVAAFFEESTAGNSSITNQHLGAAVFSGFSTAGNAAISNSLGGFTTFSENASAGHAAIFSGTLGATFFTGNSTAASALIGNRHGGLTTFSGNSTAADSFIVNRELGVTLFSGSSTAGASSIINRDLGASTFAGNSNAGASRITNRSLGATIFVDDSTADQARITNQAGGVVDLSGHNGPLAIGSVRGVGDIFLGGNNLALGGLNRNAWISGVIRDGGLSGGTGGSLTKDGLGRLTLTRANTYTGGTTLNSGVLRTFNSSALGSGPLTVNGGTLHAVGELNVGTFNWNGGAVRLMPQFGGFLNVDGDFLNGGGGGTYAINTTGMANGQTYLLTTFTGSTNFTVGDFTGLFTNINPNVQYQGQFVLEANSVLLQVTGANATGEILQNSGPVFVPAFANFFVDGAARTGAPWESNTINSLTFSNQSSLQVFNFLTVTSGLFSVPNGTATITGGTVVTPGDFTKDGLGTLIANSNFSVAGQALIKAGQLFVNATFLAQQGLTVFQNALLGGSGVIIGNVLNNGTVAPGNSPGTLSIIGNYTQSPGGTLQIEIASLSVFDRLLVTGNASLAGTLQVLAANLKYGQQYTFLQAGSISGEFDQILMPNPSRYRGRLLVNGGAGTLLVAPTSYTLVAQNGNQRNVARALDRFIPARGDDRETVSIALDLQTADQYPAAFEAISPAFYESLANITIEQANAQNQMLAQRLSAVRLGVRGFHAAGLSSSSLVHDKDGKSVRDAKDGKDILTPAPDNKWGVWVQGNGIFAKVTNVSQVPNYRFQSGGFLGGLDYRWNENFATGLYAGYQGTYAKYANGGNTTINSALFGGYATYQNGGFYSDAIVGGGYSAYAVRRPIKFSTIDRTARSRPDGGQFTAYLDFGYDWKLGNFTLGPILAGQYTYAGIAPFTETGADSLDLRVDQQNANSIRTSLGGRIAYTWKLNEKITLIPEVRLFWQHEFLENPRAIGASLDGGAGPGFDFITSAPDRDAVFAGAGISAQFGHDWNAFFYYNADFGRQDYLGHMISTGLNWSF